MMCFVSAFTILTVPSSSRATLNCLEGEVDSVIPGEIGTKAGSESSSGAKPHEVQALNGALDRQGNAAHRGEPRHLT
jgi:hypothetical protein